MPAEWEPHAATWLSWPHNQETWPDNLPQVQHAYAHMVAALARSEPVHINVNDAAMETQARACLREVGAAGTIRFHHIPTNDAWCRDHGAIFVVSTAHENPHTTPDATDTSHNAAMTMAAINWGYNAWGGKYPPFDLDNQVPLHMAEALEIEVLDGGMILEGGSIDVNGEGLLLTTESCLLNPNRNPHLGREEIEQRLCALLGVQQILWLGDGIVGDDTDGHIDDITRFVAPDTVITIVENDPSDANYAVLRDNLARLRTLRDQHGRPLRIVELPMPPALVYDGQRMPASYANFYIANRVVILPFFNHPTDQRAQQILQLVFPRHEVVGVDCSDIIVGLGAVHCLTQQVPRTTPSTGGTQWGRKHEGTMSPRTSSE